MLDKLFHGKVTLYRDFTVVVHIYSVLSFLCMEKLKLKVKGISPNPFTEVHLQSQTETAAVDFLQKYGLICWTNSI